MSSHDNEKPHLPPPSLWPIGFAVGIAAFLTGLVVSLPAAAVGAAIAVVFGFLWIRDVTAGVREPAPHVEPESRPAREATTEPVLVAGDDEPAAYPRSKFLSAATLGLGAVVGIPIAAPSLGFAVLPSFTNQHEPDVDLGPLENFPEGQFVIATYLEQPEIGEVSRRTMFVRNNGQAETPEGNKPSFTILFSRCVHLGCPVQPNGPVDDEAKKTVGEQNQVTLTPAQPSGFGCPCHGGQYDTEGNRTAGPPVRSLDRAEFSVRGGNLWLGQYYSVGEVEGTGARARIAKYGHTSPGIHVDGVSAWLYPIEVPG